MVADLAIIGAGPAGCAAAITAARAGLSVVVADRARFPRDKCCGDGLTTDALRRLEDLGLRQERVASFTAVDELYLRSSSGRIARLYGKAPSKDFAAVARRRDLDFELVRLTREQGVTVLEEAGFLSIKPGGENTREDLEIELENHAPLRARFVIAADGAWSPVRRFLSTLTSSSDARPAPPEWFAFRSYLYEVSSPAARQMWVWFEPGLLPGYAWSFPIGSDQANVGLFLRREPAGSGRSLQEAWRALVSSPFLSSLAGPRARLGEPVRSWPIPTELNPADLVGLSGRVLFVGDAARAADPFTGEGIGQAIESGIDAAGAIAEHRDPASGLAAERYQGTIAASLKIDQQIARALSRLIGSDHLARASVYGFSHSRALARQASRWLFEDYPRRAFLGPLQLGKMLRPR